MIQFAGTWMHIEIIILSEVSQKNAIWYYLYVESKMWYKSTYLLNKIRLTDIEYRLVAAKGERKEEGGNGSLGLAEASYYI